MNYWWKTYIDWETYELMSCSRAGGRNSRWTELDDCQTKTESLFLDEEDELVTWNNERLSRLNKKKKKIPSQIVLPVIIHSKPVRTIWKNTFTQSISRNTSIFGEYNNWSIYLYINKLTPVVKEMVKTSHLRHILFSCLSMLLLHGKFPLLGSRGGGLIKGFLFY